MVESSIVELRATVPPGTPPEALVASLTSCLQDMAEDLGLSLQAAVEIATGTPALTINGWRAPLVRPADPDATVTRRLVDALHIHREWLVAPLHAAMVRSGLRIDRDEATTARIELIGASPGEDPAMAEAAAGLTALDEELFEGLGLLVPPVMTVVDSRIAPGRFRVRLNNLRWPEGTGDAAARLEAVREIVHTEAAHLLTVDAVRCLFDLLEDFHPLLVAATRERFELPVVTEFLRALLSDGVSVRDLRAILEALLAVRGNQSPEPGADEASLQLDFAGYEREMRTALRHCICVPLLHKSTLYVHELAPALQAQLESQQGNSDHTALLDDVARAAEEDAVLGRPCVLLTSAAARRRLRQSTRHACPNVAVLAYDDLYEAIHVETGRRIGH